MHIDKRIVYLFAPKNKSKISAKNDSRRIQLQLATSKGKIDQLERALEPLTVAKARGAQACQMTSSDHDFIFPT